MSERRFEQSMSGQEHVKRELEDAGIKDASEWRKTFDLENNDEDGFESINQNFDTLYTYLEESVKPDDQRKIERLNAETDSTKKLEILQSMSLPAAVRAISEKAEHEETYAYKNLVRRLNFYQNLSQGKATRIAGKGEYYNGEYLEKDTEVPLEISGDAESIKLGITSDLLYSAMIGSPELASVKIATNRINREADNKEDQDQDQNQSKVKSVVKLFGCHSGIYEGSVGQWDDLGDLYNECLARIKIKFQDNNLSDEELEHKAVLLAARRLEGAFKYNGVLDTSESPYNAGFKEAIVVGQLGHRVMRQMRGMRHKIQETDLHNVERFIGKSGNNRYEKEKRVLDNDVKALEDFVHDNRDYDSAYWTTQGDDGTERQVKGKEAAELMTVQKKEESVQRATMWFNREREKINRWWEKSKAKIAQYDIGDEERRSIYSSVEVRYEEKNQNLEKEYQQEVDRLKSRTPEDLLEVLSSRKKIIDQRYEKRKSLAQKALDLHFHFNHEGRDYGSQPFNQIDWINNAPFGVIKRAHRLMSKGTDDQTVMMRALAEVNGESAKDQTPEKFILNVVRTGNAWQVVQNFERFSGITEDQHLNILLEIIKNRGGREAVENLEKFTGITPDDHLKIVQTLSESGDGQTTIENLEKFDGIKSEEKRDIIFGAVKGGGGYQVAHNFDQYSEIITEEDHRDLVLEMIKAGNAYYLNDSEMLDRFKGLEDALKKVIKDGKYEYLPQVLEAGFTIEEITRFPFLISPLVTKK